MDHMNYGRYPLHIWEEASRVILVNSECALRLGAISTQSARSSLRAEEAHQRQKYVQQETTV